MDVGAMVVGFALGCLLGLELEVLDGISLDMKYGAIDISKLGTGEGYVLT